MNPALPGGKAIFAFMLLEAIVVFASGSKNGGKRMTKKFRTNALSVLLAVLIGSLVIIPIASASEVVITNEPDYSLSEQEMDEIYDTMIADIRSSDIDTNLKNKLTKSLREIKNDKLSDADKLNTLIEVSEILLSSKSDEVTIMWSGYIPYGHAPHNDMAKIAGQKMGLDSTACNILYENAAIPDTWSLSYNHYAISGAPGQAEYYATLARNYLNDGNPSNDETGYLNLAYSLHFMTDMSQPFHYSPVYLANHAAYETYTLDNWESGKDYSSDVELNWYYYYVTDVSDSASNLASVSYQYMNYIRTTMDQYSNWGDDPTLVQNTRQCFTYGAKYNMGLVDYATR